MFPACYLDWCCSDPLEDTIRRINPADISFPVDELKVVPGRRSGAFFVVVFLHYCISFTPRFKKTHLPAFVLNFPCTCHLRFRILLLHTYFEATLPSYNIHTSHANGTLAEFSMTPQYMLLRRQLEKALTVHTKFSNVKFFLPSFSVMPLPENMHLFGLMPSQTFRSMNSLFDRLEYKYVGILGGVVYMLLLLFAAAAAC